MLAVISPAKRLNINAVATCTGSRPAFQADAAALAKRARALSVEELRKLMGLSEKLARLNAERFANFSADPEVYGARPAALMFAGDTYAGLDAGSLDADAMAWAQDHLRILSGLYGLLRPCDLIQPYRLEMGAHLQTPRGKTLYAYWGARLARALNETGQGVLVNCASVEYFKAVDPATLKLRVITPVFMELRPAGPKIISFFAKKARGAMARFMIDQRVSTPEGLKDFDSGGYRFSAGMSEGDRWVFLREATIG